MIKQSENKIHYAWIVCAGCALLLFCTSGLAVNAFTIYQPYLVSDKGLTNTQSSLIITSRYLSSMVSMILSGMFYEKVSLRKGMLISGLMVSLAFFLFGHLSGFFGCCLAGLIMGAGYGLGTMIPITLLLNRWFSDKCNTAIGICSASTGLSTLGIPSLISSAVEKYGLSEVFSFEAVIIALLVFLSFFLIKNNPSECGLTAYGTVKEDTQFVCRGLGLDKRDWLLLVPALIFIGGVMSVSYSHLAILMTGEGIAPAKAASAISVSGIALMIGKIVYGRLDDKIGCYLSTWCFSPFLAVGLLLCCFIGKSSIILFPAMIIYGIGLACLAVGLSAWPKDISRAEDYPSTIRRFQIAYASGSLAFSSLPGILADRAGGSYVTSYIIFFIMSFAVIGIIQHIYVKAGCKGTKRKCTHK